MRDKNEQLWPGEGLREAGSRTIKRRKSLRDAIEDSDDGSGPREGEIVETTIIPLVR